MKLWNNSGWEQFWEIPDDEQVEAILLSTYGFDPKFLWEQLLPRVFCIGDEIGSAEWHMNMKDNLNKTPVIVFCDTKQYIAQNRESYPVFERCGGYIRNVSPTQHSKLWMIKTKSKKIKTNSKIRIAVGSCNLTQDAFQNQIQYVWMYDLEMDENKKGSYETTYLSNFISALFASAINHTKTIDNDKGLETQWNQWINTCSWPENVKLIASVPGNNQKSGGKNISEFKYGLSAMASIQNWLNLPKKNRSHLHLYVQVFSTFEYDKNKHKKWLENFKKLFGAGRLIFLWPEKKNIEDYPQWEKMQLSCSLLNRLKEQGEVESLNFKKKYIENSELKRLPHGKFYSLWNNKKEYPQWTMVGSSNFSPSAWGLGEGEPGNFELNVITRHDQHEESWIFEEEEELTDPFCQSKKEETGDEFLYLLDAYEENGKIYIDLFINKKSGVEKVVFFFLKNDSVCESHKKTSGWQKCQFSDCKDALQVKAVIYYKDGKEVSTVANIRRNNDAEELLQEAFPQYNEEWKIRWILQQYGWKEVKQVKDYQVLWMEAGLNALKIVDQWNKKFNKAITEWQKKALQQDADELMRAFEKRTLDKKNEYEWLGWEMARNELEKLKNLIEDNRL